MAHRAGSTQLLAIEIKSGTTFARDRVDSALRFAALAGATVLPPIIVWGGADSVEFLGCRVLSWRDLAAS